MLGLENVEDLSVLEDTSLAHEKFKEVSRRRFHAWIARRAGRGGHGCATRYVRGPRRSPLEEAYREELLRAGKDALQHVSNHTKGLCRIARSTSNIL